MIRLSNMLPIAALPFVALLAGCGGGGGGGGGGTPTTVTVNGTVESDEATPQDIEGARVVLGGKVATTDANGRYAFNNVKVTSRQTTVTVSRTVSKDQFGTVLDDNVQLTLGQTVTLDTVRLPLRANTGSVSGKVVRSTDGGALVNVLVTIGTGEGAQSGRTDDNGQFVLSGVFTGQQPYRAEASGFLASTGLVDNVIQGQTTALPQNIRLVPTTSTVTVTGHVLDEDGNPIAGATVTAGNESDDTDANGRYELTQAPVGTQILTASKDGFNASQRQLEITGDQGEVDFVLFTSNEAPPDLPFNIAGTVKDGSGNPLPGATVVALAANDRTEVGRFETGADGKFYLFVPAGSYILRAEKAGHQAVEQQTNLPSGGQIVTGLTLILN